MALDTKLTQTLNIRANGDALLRLMDPLGNRISKLAKDMQSVANPSTAKGRAEINKLNMELQKTLSSAKTIQDLINNGSRSGRSRNALFAGLDEQSLGKKTLSASKLKQELAQTATASSALEVRLAQLYKKFSDLGNVGKAVGSRNIAKAMGFQDAIQQAQALERQISRLDARNAARGGLSGAGSTLRTDLQNAQTVLLNRIKGGTRVDFSKELGQVQLLVEQYGKLTRAEMASADQAVRDAAKRQSAILDTINMNEAQLRASINRAAGGYSFTKDQARTFDIRALNREIEAGTARLTRYQDVMSRALAAGKSRSVDMLATGFQNLKARVAEATAQVKAFESLPEQRVKSVTDMLFSKGGVGAFATRVLGASAIGYAGFAAFNSIQSSVGYVIQLNDAMAKLQAIAGATDPEMAKLSKSIFDVAENSRYSTLEITQAATQIAQAGYAADDAGKVLQGALALATASGSTVAEGVDTMTSALGAFNLQANESGRVADVLTNALNESKLSMTQVQAAIQYAGATAHEAGISLEELGTLAAMAANAGIKSGSTIGTGLRMLLADLEQPTEKFKAQLQALGLTMADVDVKTQGLDGVIRNLTKAGFSADAAYASFQTRAAAFFLAIRGQMDTWDELSNAITQTGSAAKAQDTAMGSLTAQWQKFKNLMTEIVVGLSGPFLTALTGALRIINAFAQALVDLNKGFVEALGGSTSAASQFGLVFTDTLIPALIGFYLGGPFGAIVGAIIGFTGAISGSSDASQELAAKTSQAQEALKAQKQTVSAVDDAINRLITRHSTLKDHSIALQVETQTLTERFSGLSSELKGAALSYDNLLAAMLRYRGAQLRDAAVKADQTRFAAQQQGNGALSGLFGNSTALQNIFAHPARNPRASVTDVQTYVNNTRGSFNYGNMSTEDLLVETTNVRALLLGLQREKDQNNTIQQLEELLQKRLDLLEQIKKSRADINGAERDIGLYQEMSGPGGKVRDSYVQDARVSIDAGLDANKKSAGSGDVKLQAAINLAQSRIEALTKQLSALDPSSAKALAIQNSIDQLSAQVARVASEAALDGGKGVHAKPGTTLNAYQVKEALLKAFPGIKIGSAAPRGPGDPAYVPGTLHGAGRALDIQSLPPGVTSDNILAFIESLGLQIAPGHNGFWDEMTRPSTAKTWTGPHLHVGWQAKMSQYARGLTSAGNKEDNVTKRLLEEGDQFVLDTISKNIDTIIQNAKSGKAPPAELEKQLDVQIKKYQDAALKKFDDANPTKGLTPEQLKIRAENRQKLIADIAAKAADWHSKLYKQIEDTVEKLLDVTLTAMKAALDKANYDAEAPVRSQQQRLDTIGNRRNRHQFGDGALFLENRKMEDAQLLTNRTKLAASSIYSQGLSGIVSQQQALVNSLPQGSEARIDAQKKLVEYQKDYNDALQQTAQLQADVAAQTDKLVPPSLKMQLEGSAQAWLENSGAMDSWQKQVADNVGPALDTLTSGFSQFFTDVMSGQKSFKQALGDMLKTFAMFVVQMIAKALALAAVKAILKAIGLKMPSDSYDGGPVDTTKHVPSGVVGPRFNGGPADHLYDGGSVLRGVSNRDSALYNLAHGEYVVRSKSVSDLGMDFMDAINKHGSKGLAKMRGASVLQNFQLPKQTTNVYVVKPDSLPPMGPNDVLVTVQEDILQGGATKKLIKQVAQGG